MKKNIILILSMVIVLLNSCYKEEPLMPSSSENSDRFEFPQGNNDYDQIAKDVFDRFGVKIIYKDFVDTDFNLSWTNPGIGKTGYPIPENQRKDAVHFMANHIFGFLTPEITKKVLPPYFYIADSISQYSKIENPTSTFESVTPTSYFYTGIDFWSFTWNNAASWSKMNGTYTAQPSNPLIRPRTPFQVFYRRGVMLKEVYKNSIIKGNIVPPEGFNTGFDFTTKVESAAAMKDNPNYYLTRGFPGILASSLNFNLSRLTSVTQTGPSLIFRDYVLLSMRYDADSIEKLMPKASYPMIHEKYTIVIEHMKNKYGIDLTKIATKPENGYQ